MYLSVVWNNPAQSIHFQTVEWHGPMAINSINLQHLWYIYLVLLKCIWILNMHLNINPVLTLSSYVGTINKWRQVIDPIPPAPRSLQVNSWWYYMKKPASNYVLRFWLDLLFSIYHSQSIPVFSTCTCISFQYPTCGWFGIKCCPVSKHWEWCPNKSAKTYDIAIRPSA